MTGVLVHVVLATFHPHVSEVERARLQLQQASLGAACGGEVAGILHWTSGWNLDQRKNYHLVEFSVFADEDAFQRFKAHPAHRAFADEMRLAADWVIGDVAADLPFG
jgi:hypothetical protein